MSRSHRSGGVALRAALVLTLLATGGTLYAQTPGTVRGSVHDAASGDPLSGVQVRAGTRLATTDALGRYTLTVAADTVTVTFLRLGYGPFSARASALGERVSLTAMPLLLDAIAVRAETGGGRLAAGTALAVATASRDEMHGRGATSVAEALAGVEGLSVSRPGAWGARPLLRGVGGERLAVMVDGNRVNRACGFGMDQGLATIDPATVERVEVVTGPGTALYGSGSIGGVVNVVTRRGGGAPGVSGEVRTGLSAGVPGATAGATLRASGGTLDLAASVDGATYGDYRTADGRVDGSGLRQGTGDARIGWTPAPAHRVQLQGQWYEGRDIGWPTMAGGSIPLEQRRSLAADYGWQAGAGILDAVSARAYVQRIDHHMRMQMVMGGMPGAAHDAAAGPHGGHAGHGGHGTPAGPATSLTEARSHSTTSGARLQARLAPHAAVHVDAGMEATRWDAEATRWTERSGMNGAEPARETFRSWPGVRLLDAGAFAQGEWRIREGTAVSAGLRADAVHRRAEGYAATRERVHTGNVGFRAALGAGFGVRGTYGIGYRIPDPTELFGLAARPDGFVYRGNPELRTETGRNVEGSLTHGGERHAVSLTAFRNRIRGMISPVVAHGDTFAGRPVRSYANVARAEMAGASGSASLSPAGWLQMRGSATLVRGRDLDTGAPLAGVPPLEGGVALRVAPAVGPPWVELEGRGAAAQNRVSPALHEAATPSWAVLSLRTGFAVGRVDVVAGMDNLLDARWRSHVDPAGLLRPGRMATLRVSRAF